MAIHPTNRFDKTKYQTAGTMAERHAKGMAERFNEPAYILEGEDEFVVVRGVSWRYRNSWGDLPTWARKNPDEFLVAIHHPEDKLAGNYKKAAKTVEKMLELARKLQYDYRFEMDEMFRDYSDVRLTAHLASDAAEHLTRVITHLSIMTSRAIEDHKKNGYTPMHPHKDEPEPKE